MKVATLEESLKNVIRSYAVREFYIGAIFLDMEFKCIKDRNLLRVIINIIRRGELVNRLNAFKEK